MRRVDDGICVSRRLQIGGCACTASYFAKPLPTPEVDE